MTTNTNTATTLAAKLAEEAKRLAGDLAAVYRTGPAFHADGLRQKLHAAIDALAELRASTPSAAPVAVGEAVAWGIYARIDGAWALQFPVYGSEHLARRDLGRFVAGIELGVRPLYAHPPTAQVAERQPLTGWQPIETAPKVVGRILGSVEGRARFICWGKASHVPMYGWVLTDQGAEDCDLCQPDGWMELPAGIPASGEAKSHE